MTEAPRQKKLPAFVLQRCGKCSGWRDHAESEKCCLHGRNILDDSVFPPWQKSFLELILRIPNLSRESRMLNNSCSFVSIGTACADSKRDELTETGWVRPTGIPKMYGLYGRTYHYVSADNHRPTAFYMFGCDPNECFSPLCDDSLKPHLLGLLAYLNRVSPFAKMYKRIVELPQTAKSVHFKRPRARVDEPFVALGTDEDPEIAPLKTFALHPKTGECVYYSAMHRCGEVGAYPLLFPSGDGGWYGEKKDGGTTVWHPRYKSGAQVDTVHQYVKYMLYQHGDRLTLLGTVFQQWLLDMFSRWQEIVFHFMAKDKRVASSVKLRLCHFKDFDITKTNKFGKKGRPFAIPATVPGSPAARRKSCRECMAVVSQLGGGHGWITATCNPKWPEIINAARSMYREQTKDYDDARKLPAELLAHIATRVYWRKYLNFVRLLRDGQFSFGHRTVWIQIVHEFQQRYFPHFHLLCRFEDYDTLTEEQLDTMYCARLFFYENCPLSLASTFDITNDAHRLKLRQNTACSCQAHKLYRVVSTLMQHTCSKSNSTSCRHKDNIRSDGTCGKRFPHEAGTATSQKSFTNGAGFFQPRRPYPEDANVISYNCHVLGYMIDNIEGGYFAFHNNWDQCAGAHTLEYVFEYQHKGPDFTEISIDEALRDVATEFKEYQRLRHIGFSEAIMRFLSMDMVHNEPSVSEVSIHLPNEQFVAIHENATKEEFAARLASKETPLLRYFWRPKDLAHVKLTEYYSLYDLRTECAAGKVPIKDNPPVPMEPKFVVRRTKTHVCRIEYGSSMKVERYCLGLILRRFARSSFSDCLTVAGTLHTTFASAAYALGIFSDYNEYEMCLQELINSNLDAWKDARKNNTRVPVVGHLWKARVAFTTMIMNGGAAQKLFDDFGFYLTRDAVTRGNTTDAMSDFWLLQWLKAELHKNQMTLDDVGLTDPDPQEINDARVREQESVRVKDATVQLWVRRISKLDQYQRQIFDLAVSAVMDPLSPNRLLYVDARAGCGKTFLCQCISAFLRSKSKMVLTSAPSALAASLHMGGTTCHKCFGLPVTNDREKRVSLLSARSYQGSALRLCDMLIIDEFSMLDILSFDCADRACRDMCGVDKPFAGKVLLCCGEFAQLPPVVPNGLRSDIIAASCVSHPLWPSIKKFQLQKRWRNADDKAFQNFCDALASDKRDGFFDSHKFLPGFRTCTTSKTAVDMLVGGFRDFPSKLQTSEDFNSLANTSIYKSVVAAYHHNSAIELDFEIAQRVRRRLGEDEILCHSSDSATKGCLLTPEFMEEIADKHHQIPPTTLRLFRGCKIRLLRNFHPSRGLCNGTLLLVRKVGRHFLECQIISDSEEYNGNIETLFRFKFDVTSKALEFSRIQFPVASAFAGTVHRFQGQSVPQIGLLIIDQRKNPFCHGQTYVAYTRARTCTQVVLITNPNSNTSVCLTYKELTFASSTLVCPAQQNINWGLDEDMVLPAQECVSVSDNSYDGHHPSGVLLEDAEEDLD